MRRLGLDSKRVVWVAALAGECSIEFVDRGRSWVGAVG